MTDTIEPHTLRRLDIQGFDTVPEEQLAEVAPWLRLAFALCALLAAVGTIAASPTILLALAPIAALAAALPVHPFDLIYNLGIRHLTGTGPLPKRGAPGRFACGMGAVFLVVDAWAFSTGHAVVGYSIGAALTLVASLVSTTDICIPSMMYRAVLGEPRPRDTRDRSQSDLQRKQESALKRDTCGHQRDLDTLRFARHAGSRCGPHSRF